MAHRRTTIWGWGFEDEQPTPEQKKKYRQRNCRERGGRRL